MPPFQMTGLDHVVLRVADLALAITPFDEAAIRAHLAEHAVEITDSGQRYGAEGDGPSIYVKDPEGNIVELKGPPNA